jgi:hypothetical protein
MPALKLWSSVTLALCGLLSACSDQQASEPATPGAGSSSTAGAPRDGDASTSGGSSGRAAGGSSSSGDGGGEPPAGSAGEAVGGEGLGGTASDPASGGEPNGDAGAAGGSTNCPAQPTTLQLSCTDVVERWSPSYVLDSNQWLFDASAAQYPIQGGSLTFFSTYSSSDFPICGVVSIEVSGSQLLATLTMDSHYLTASQVAKFSLTDVCGNHYDYEPTGSTCGSIVSSEANSWSAGCANSCPGACN